MSSASRSAVEAPNEELRITPSTTTSGKLLLLMLGPVPQLLAESPAVALAWPVQ